MRPPSFEPELSRIRFLRALAAITGFGVTVGVSLDVGVPVIDALLRGLGVAALMFFLGWAGAVLLLGELHTARIAALRRNIERRDADRSQRMEEILMQRYEAMHGAAPTQIPPMNRGGGAGSSSQSDREAA